MSTLLMFYSFDTECNFLIVSSGERCIAPPPVPAEHKLTAVWKLSDAPSNLCNSKTFNIQSLNNNMYAMPPQNMMGY